MIDNSKIADILNNSPSVDILKLRNREIIITFLVNTFSNQQGTISSEKIHNQLADYLEAVQVEIDEEIEITLADTYEIKAKKYKLIFSPFNSVLKLIPKTENSVVSKAGTSLIIGHPEPTSTK